ncbi:hypothetical protein BH09MYX1_BH09MYX1_44410 [soil metagenome]
MRAFPCFLLISSVAASVTLPVENAQADDVASAPKDDTDRASGFGDCTALRERNEKELQMWSPTQPAVPYAYPKRDLLLDAPWIELGRGFASAAGVIVASVLPNVGVLFRASLPEFLISFPWQFPFGPPSSCTRTRGTFDVVPYRPNRLLLEPGFAIAKDTSTFFLRPGYRFLVHPASWFVGLGGGIGTTMEIVGKEPFRPSVSPEFVVQLGACCTPGYFTIALRGDFFFAGENRYSGGISFGVTYF